jgi:hypothetical protein
VIDTGLAEFIDGPFVGRRERLPLCADGPAPVIELGVGGLDERQFSAFGTYHWRGMTTTPEGEVVDRYSWSPRQ